MSNRKYPRLGSSTMLKPKHGKPDCECCDTKATHRIDVQTGWFRGDDDVFFVCGRHLQMAREDKWRQLYAHHESKKDFVARKNLATQPQAGGT